MADFTPDPVISPVDTAPVEQPVPKGFLATPAGKLIVIGSAVAALLVVLGVVGGLVVLNLGKDAVEGSMVKTVKTASAKAAPAVATQTAEATAAPKIVMPVTNKDVFTSRDPFEPVVRPVAPQEPSASTTGSAAETRTLEPNTLILQDIITVDGVQKAMLVWDGKDYTLAAGDVIAGTPWKLLSMTKTSVTMLYGDVQVTLSIGEGVGR
jgi:hypothetical protein